MTIKKIRIKNTRGISDLSITQKIVKNRPNILVAPNGFGKTSIATAFKNIAHQTSIKIADDERHEHINDNQAHLELEVDFGAGVQILAAKETAHSNDIRKTFDIHVISDLRKVKATSQNFGSFSKANGKLVIDPIIICPKVTKPNIAVGIREVRQQFGTHGAGIPKFEDSFWAHHCFIERSLEIVNTLNKLTQKRNWAKIENLRKTLNSSGGDLSQAVLGNIGAIDSLSDEIPEFRSGLEFLKKTCKCDETQSLVYLWHLAFQWLQNKEQTLAFLRWKRYECFKNSLESALKSLTSSWKETHLKESKGNLQAILPEPDHISNGQRDVLLLTCMLYSARIQLEKKHAILVIDEVFDYLDDANLTVAQYFVSTIINDYKDQGRCIYPIILTHLNPAFFRNYVFSNQNVLYLDNASSFDSSDAMKKLIAARDKAELPESLKTNISKYLVHYHTSQPDFQADLAQVNGTRSSWGKLNEFPEFLLGEFEKYKNSTAYDPLAICAITRRRIEEKAFIQISTKEKAEEFFTTYKTTPKLEFAISLGANVPESHFLLRVIFDDGMHWKEQRDNTIPIVAKLSNPIIRQMIIDAVEEV